MNLLALDASTEACAVGIQTSDGKIVQSFEVAPRRHTELLPKMLDSVLLESGLQKAQIDGCIVGIGPGAFTGIRIGIATIQGIALGLNVPCFAVSALHAIAQQAVLNNSNLLGKLIACIDARMQEMYFAEYTIDKDLKVDLLGVEKLLANDQFKYSPDIAGIVGTGVNCLNNDVKDADYLILEPECYPTAESLFKIYQQHDLDKVSPEQLQASYIRNNVTYQNMPK